MVKNKDNNFLNEMKPQEPTLKEQVLIFLVKGKKTEASELIVQSILHDKSIYSLRDDRKEELWMYHDGIYIPEGKSYVKEYCRNILGLSYTTQFVNEVIAKVIVDTFISHDSFFNNQCIEEIPVLNGILNLKTKKLKPFTPKQIFFNKVNATYNTEKDCPNAKTFFNELLDENDVKAMQELFGFCLWKDNFTETSFLFRANGSNGKTKTMELLKLFLTPENCASVPLAQLESAGSFQVIELQNKLVNIAGELSKSALQETQMFKVLTGRDPITADRKFLRPVTFVNSSKLIFSGNDRPPTYDLSDGFFRRWIIFHFKKVFVDKDVYDKLDDKKNYGIKDPDVIANMISPDEFSGLLNWAVEGLHRLLKNKKFSNTQSTEITRLEWLKDSNNFVVFFEKFMIHSKGNMVSKEDLREVYGAFCSDEGLECVSDKAIAWFMSIKGIIGARRTRSNHSVIEQIGCWSGLKFRAGIIDERGWSSNADSFVELIEINGGIK